MHEVAGWNASARLGGLEDEGVISRREGSGTYVRTYKGTGNRNPFHIISGLDSRPSGTRKELVSISTVAAPDFVADALGLPRKAPVILMVRKLLDNEAGADELITVDESYLLPERFAGLTPERFTKGFLEDDTLYKFYDREFGIVIIRQKCKVRFERVGSTAAPSLDLPEGLEVLRTDRVSYDITKEPVEYRINRGRVERTLVSLDIVI